MFKIAISGKGGSGKSTMCKIIADLVSDNYSSFEFKSQSFADPIKKITSILFPQIPKEHLYGPSKLRNEVVEGIDLNGNSVTVRDLLVDIGQSYKKYDESIFVNIFHEKNQKFCSGYLKARFLVATDIRFPTEFNYAKTEGYVTIRIKRNESLQSTEHTEMIQESILDKSFDFVITNDSSLADLKEEVRSVFKKITQ